MDVNREAMAVRDASARYDLQAATSAVPVGYKQTEVGVIPDDWDLEFIENVASITTGNRNTQDRVEDGEYPFFVRSQTVEHIDTYSFDGEAVLTAGDGVGTGKVFHYIVGKCDVHQRVYRISDFCDRLNGYFFFLYFSRNFYNRIMQMTAKSSVDSVRRDMIANMLVPAPRMVEEQRAIATALSDVDALLEGLDRLIAKKRDLKQAAMQQLLTGQTRLPRFEGEWETMPLEEVADIRSGGTPSTTNQDFWNGGVPWCTPTDITALRGRKYLTETERTISTKGLQTSSAEIIPPKSIIMTTRATIGECAINTIPMTTNQGFKNLVPSTADSEFFYYLMTTQKQRLIQLCGGSTFLEVGKKQLQTFEVKLPVDIGEQTAIATVLSDMDAEIEALEKRRAKTAALKQAMMQELLTGRTRLVKPHTDEEAVRA